jgi:hypothetical protein
VQELKRWDFLICKNFCQEMLTEMGHGDIPGMSDEAYFHLDHSVNEQISSEENTPQLHQESLHREWVTVWSTISSRVIIRPHLFEDYNGSVTTVMSIRLQLL